MPGMGMKRLGLKIKEMSDKVVAEPYLELREKRVRDW